MAKMVLSKVNKTNFQGGSTLALIYSSFSDIPTGRRLPTFLLIVLEVGKPKKQHEVEGCGKSKSNHLTRSSSNYVSNQYLPEDMI